MNNVTLLGRLTKDPELRYLQTGTNSAYARFTLAVDKQLSRDKKQEMESKNQATADFINIVVWGKLAENCVKFTQKGKRVLVQGRIQTGSYVAQDGSRRYTTDVVASNIEFIDWREDGGYNRYTGTGAPASPGNKNTFNNTNAQVNDPAQGDHFGQIPSTMDDDFQYGADFDPTNDEDGRIPF